jgi:hypothetical protein
MNHAGYPMTTLLDLVRKRRAEPEAARPESVITDEQRIAALMVIQARAEQGDPDARATLAAIKKLFSRSGS